MKHGLALALMLGACLAWWAYDPSRYASRTLPDDPQAAVSAAADCERADQVGDEAAVAMNAAGARSKWMTKWARDVGRRGWSAVKRQKCASEE